jgi:chromosome segregation ATPase
MEESHADWLQEHMRDHIANSSALESPENVLSFRCPPNSETDPGAAALNLVYQAAEHIRDVDDCPAERQDRAETLAKQAIEMLEIAEARVRSAESARLAAEAEIKEFSDRVEKELSIKLQEVEEAMEQTASRIAATEAQLSTTEQRARTADMRADEAENTLKRIEEAIRIQILEKMPGNARRTAIAA